MSTSAVGSVTSGTTTATTAPKKELGKDEFLKLLIVQLQNQDPLQPVDNQAFIAQLAQFSSVEQLQAVGSRLDTLLLAQASANQMSTASLVGKDLLYRADGIDAGPGQPSAAQLQLTSRADVTLLVRDASGRTVRTLQLGSRAAGAVDVAWDGKDEAGNTVAAGHYQVTLSAKDATGKDVAVELRARGRVRGVTYDGDVPMLLVGASKVRMSDVVEINQA
jgi:flagellar basal-body rod modification protein FlgD